MSEMYIAVGPFFSCTAQNSCYSTTQHVARCRNREQFVEETRDIAARGRKEERLQTGGKDHGGESDVEGQEIRGVKGAKIVKREPPKKGCSKTCIRSLRRPHCSPWPEEHRSKLKSSLNLFLTLTSMQGSFVGKLR